MNIYDLANAHRALLLANDLKTKQNLINAYGTVDKDLQRRLGVLLDLIERRRAAGEEVSRAWLQKEARYSALLEGVAQQTKALAYHTADETTKSVQVNFQLGVRDANVLIQAAQSNAIVAGAFDQMNAHATANMVAYLDTNAPLGKLLSRITEEMPVEAVQRAKDVLLVGVATGQAPRVVAHNLREATDLSLNRSLTVARTESLRAYRQASLQVYADSDVIEKWQWLSTKSARTCPACLAMDAKIFEKNEHFPAHVRCRCTCVPVVGDPQPRESGEDWLKAQDPETQDTILGKTAAEVWRKGEVTLQDFVGVRQNAEYGPSVFHDSLKGAKERAEQRAKTGTISTGNATSSGAKDAGNGSSVSVTETRRQGLEALAKKELDAIAPLVSDATGLKSNWSGRVIVDALTNSRGTKPFECDIKMSATVMETGERGRTYLHELLHAHSVGYIEADFRAGMGWEEGVVEALQRLIRKRVVEGLPSEMQGAFAMPDDSPVERRHLYNIYIAALEDVRIALNAESEAFYRDLLAQPIGKRSAYLLMQRVMKQPGENREVAKQAYIRASGVMKRNLNKEEVGNARGIAAEVDEASRKLFGEN